MFHLISETLACVQACNDRPALSGRHEALQALALDLRQSARRLLNAELSFSDALQRVVSNIAHEEAALLDGEEGRAAIQADALLKLLILKAGKK
jgi:hypothetical protein